MPLQRNKHTVQPIRNETRWAIIKIRKNIIEKEYNCYHRDLQAYERERQIGMRQPIGAMIAKITVGFLFCVIGFIPFGGEISIIRLLILLIIGGGFIAWGLVPYLLGRKVHEEEALKEILAKPLQTYEDAELHAAINRVHEDSDNLEDELKKYKDMLESGLISRTDYEQKKKQLLNI